MASLRAVYTLNRTKTCKFYVPLSFSKVFAIRPSSTEIDNTPTVNSFKAFYKFPYIVAARTVQRAKFYQSVLTVMYTPVAIYLHHSHLISQLYLQVTVLAAVFTVAMLYVVGNFFNRFVGTLYLNQDRKDTLRVAHLTFWGHRKDVDVPLKHILPLGTVGNQDFVTIHRMDSDLSFRMTLRFGGIVDEEAFTYVFGKIYYSGK